MADDIKIVGLSSKKSSGTNWKVISAIVGIVVLSIGVIAGILLVRQNQNIQEKAAECSAGGFQCPSTSDPSLLRDCSTGETFPNDTLCNTAGQVEVCGSSSANARQFCCPSAGGAWTTDLTACSCAAAGPTNMTVENTTGTSVKLKWTAGTGGTTTRIWVSKNTDPTGSCTTGGAANCIVNDQSVSIATTEYEVTGLTANTRYYWRLMTFAQSGCDAGTVVANFTTIAGGPTATATSTASATAAATGASSPTATATSTSTSTTRATATPTTTTRATATSTSRATATSTSTTRATATARATSSGTAFPVPETGAEWPTVIGAGFGIVMLLVSLALAL